LPGNSWPGATIRGSLARGDRVIAPSTFVSRAMIERYGIAPARITVIPRAVDTARFSPAAINVEGIDALCRFVGHCADMPAALAAADVVVVPSLEAPLSGRAAAEAQAMGRPVIVSTVGMLPENMLGPPRMPEELRTGWLVRPGNIADLARATSAALSLNTTAYEALGARARQFAEFMFSPQSVADAIRGVYTSLLARDA